MIQEKAVTEIPKIMMAIFAFIRNPSTDHTQTANTEIPEIMMARLGSKGCSLHPPSA
jgi:hypothetical protein